MKLPRTRPLDQSWTKPASHPHSKATDHTYLQSRVSCPQTDQLHVLAHQPRRRPEHQIGTLLVVQAPHKSKERHLQSFVRIAHTGLLSGPLKHSFDAPTFEMTIVLAVHALTSDRTGSPSSVCKATLLAALPSR